MDQQQFNIFRGITLDYLTKLAPDQEGQPEFKEAYLQFGEPLLLDYTSLVRIRGEYEGAIYITAPRGVIEMLLKLHGETEISPATLEDMTRELSNILAGNASHAFGGNWEISVPVTVSPDNGSTGELPDSGFVMPIQWHGVEVFLVIGLTDPEAKAAAQAA